MEDMVMLVSVEHLVFIAVSPVADEWMWLLF